MSGLRHPWAASRGRPPDRRAARAPARAHDEPQVRGFDDRALVLRFPKGGDREPRRRWEAHAPNVHLLHQDVLDHLHILANYEWDKRPLLSLILVGLPEMHDRMRLRKNRSLWSRMHTRLHLGEATPADTAEYVAYRLEQVGSKQSVFTSDALAMLHEAAGGRLRDTDRIAADALKRAARRKLKSVDRELIEAAATGD